MIASWRAVSNPYFTGIKRVIDTFTSVSYVVYRMCVDELTKKLGKESNSTRQRGAGTKDVPVSVQTVQGRWRLKRRLKFPFVCWAEYVGALLLYLTELSSFFKLWTDHLW